MVIVVTGGSSGIGAAIAGLLFDKNHKVYSLSRRIGEVQGINYISCDITDSVQIESAIKYIANLEGKIDVLINNAGMGISGPSEHDDTLDVERLFDVNLLGLIKTTQVCLPYLRENRGRIINIGSVAGDFAIPFQSAYSASKAAIEVYSLALANELRPFKVKVSVVLPGDTKTEFTNARKKNEVETVYEKRVARSLAKMEKDEKNGVPASKVAKVVARVLHKRKPPLKTTVGVNYKLLIFLKRILPMRLVNYIIYQIYGK